MSVHALLYTHPKNCAGVPLSVRLKFRGVSPPDTTDMEQTTHENSEVGAAVADRAPPLPLHTHPTGKGTEEIDGKRGLYMKLVASAF